MLLFIFLSECDDSFVGSIVTVKAIHWMVISLHTSDTYKSICLSQNVITPQKLMPKHNAHYVINVLLLSTCGICRMGKKVHMVLLDASC